MWFENDAVRVIDLNEPPTVAEFYEIRSADLADVPSWAAMPDKVAATHRAIDTWISRNDFPRSRVELQGSVVPRHSEDLTRANDVIRALHTAFGQLSDEDHRRIVVPFDVLMRMLGGR